MDDTKLLKARSIRVGSLVAAVQSDRYYQLLVPVTVPAA